MTPTKGKRTTLGSYAYEHNVPDHDAPIVEALTKAGGILIGKTTTPEFAYSSFTESPLWIGESASKFPCASPFRMQP